MSYRISRLPLLAGLAGLLLASPLMAAKPGHALSIYGDVKYPADFKHFDYVNPDAPKGGELKQAVIGSFDNFNPFISQGDAAAGLGGSYVWEPLMVSALDEPFTEYGLLAKSASVADDHSSVTFYLRPEAKFSDGSPVTAEDVKFSFDTLTRKGSPMFGFYYQSIKSADVIDAHTVRFNFVDSHNRELPLIIGQLPVLSKKFFTAHDFSKPALTLPVGSGPYKLVDFQPGKRVVYQLRDDYWGKNLPVNVGQHNFARMTYEYFRDDTVALEAFKGGTYDFRFEVSAKNWATAYQSPALNDGRIIKEEVKNSMPAGMQAFVFNIRRPLFQDRTLRQAIILALDFEWSNKNLFYGQYTRTRSYFDNSEMAATGLPGPEELKILEPLRGKIPDEVFTKAYQPPRTDTPGGIRANLRKAMSLLSDAGYTIKDNQLYTPDGKPVKFEFLLSSPLFERIVLPFTRNLKVLGINVSVRKVDSNQYTDRVRHFDYDMIVASFPESSSPGNEQRNYWTSEAAKRVDSNNLIGISDPAIDHLVDLLIKSDTREQLVTRCRALDRVLQWGYYVVPSWYNDHYRLAYRNTLAHPETFPPYSFTLDTWWSRNDK